METEQKGPVVEIETLLAEILKKLHSVSCDNVELIDRINSIYIRLDVLSEVSDQLSKFLKISSEDYLKIVQSSVERVLAEWKKVQPPENNT
jgi:hypothetical protein